MRFAYMYLLGRNPENEAVVQNGAAFERNIRQLRHDVMQSAEWACTINQQVQDRMISSYLKCAIEKFSTINDKGASGEIMVVQTADAERYSGLLAISSQFNRKYADIHGLGYQSYVGVKRGAFPHHAMYNRIYMLNDLIDEGFSGWVVYVDADAIFSRPDFPIRSYLASLRDDGKIMALHSVYQKDDPRYDWWNINNGAFAIDLSSALAQNAVRAWRGIYTDLYSMDDYRQASSWDSIIINDQASMSSILRHFNMEPHVHLGDLQSTAGFVTQVLRAICDQVSPDQEMEQRKQQLMSIGQATYGN
ncbi:hypothetical protein DM806_08345 [Sphingobium lactosutens]|uniref:hypothetical protein n=1 Tax=Sphingobium lactosutens TaxID=522773 RepID=UPI0015BA3907|nr:hypothetical protein [Sphingobium lactosutens]NWK95682.1 hypothetical protein [Sphingobium lactosutens]